MENAFLFSDPSRINFSCYHQTGAVHPPTGGAQVQYPTQICTLHPQAERAWSVDVGTPPTLLRLKGQAKAVGQRQPPAKTVLQYLDHKGIGILVIVVHCGREERKGGQGEGEGGRAGRADGSASSRQLIMD
jgi:hypothetical protein